jgi:hypothetical protein
VAEDVAPAGGGEADAATGLDADAEGVPDCDGEVEPGWVGETPVDDAVGWTLGD